jgi:hypothetical protein
MLHEIPLFRELAGSSNILIAGAGGGFDIFCGLPLYHNLLKQGKNVVLANYSFTELGATDANCVYPNCYEIRSSSRDLSGTNYFPEKYLSLWLQGKGLNPPVYAFSKCGVNPLKLAYKFLIKKHAIDTVILVDGGTDSLMFGDEAKLGTPVEDICSMAAVCKSGIRKAFLVCLGFGIDHFHGVSHYRFLENVATIIRSGGYLGAFQVLKEMDEAAFYQEGVDFANGRMRGMESIVSSSISGAIDGEFGNVNKLERTADSTLWINPLMSMYWAFELRAVIRQIRYFDNIRDTNSLSELRQQLSEYRNSVERPREFMPIPL